MPFDTPNDIFHPQHYAKVRLPAMQAETLPPWCYTSQAFYNREVTRIFHTQWIFVGRADRIPDPGSYFTVDYVGVPLIIIRDRSGAPRAFANSCRHRGARVVTGEGRCNVLRCPYHSWAYSPEGKLVAAPDMEHTENFNKAEWGLTPVKLETLGGFMWVNLDPDSVPLADYLGDLAQHLKSYNLEDFVCVRRKEYDVGCNWKLFFENFAEQYHIPFVHSGTLYQKKRTIHPPDETHGNYVAKFITHKGSRALLEGETGFPPIPSLEGRHVEGTYYPSIFPNTMFGCCIDLMWYVELQPLGPRRTKVIVGSCVPKAHLGQPDFEQTMQKYYKRWDTTIPEDIMALELQQQGLELPLAKPGRFCTYERLVHDIDNWILDRVLGNAR